VDSKIEIDPNQAALALTNPTHPLTGQPDQVGNLMLEWDRPEWGTGLRLLFNHVGDKLYVGGTLGVPDVFEDARTIVDAVWSQELAFLARGLSLKLSGSNLSGEERVWSQGGEVFRAYDPGRTYGLSFSYEPF
jgi:outer membrane receptor protein involved in Fe transport